MVFADTQPAAVDFFVWKFVLVALPTIRCLRDHIGLAFIPELELSSTKNFYDNF